MKIITKFEAKQPWTKGFTEERGYVPWLWTYFSPFPNASIADFEQINAFLVRCSHLPAKYTKHQIEHEKRANHN